MGVAFFPGTRAIGGRSRPTRLLKVCCFTLIFLHSSSCKNSSGDPAGSGETPPRVDPKPEPPTPHFHLTEEHLTTFLSLKQVPTPVLVSQLIQILSTYRLSKDDFVRTSESLDGQLTLTCQSALCTIDLHKKDIAP